MGELVFLLLPIAAFSGWAIGIRSNIGRSKKKNKAVSSQYFSGLNYILNEQPDRAVDMLLRVLDVNSEIVEIHLMLGNLFRKKGEVDRAIKVHKSILVRPNLPEANYIILKLELAKDYISAGLLDRAELILLELIENDAEIEISLNLLIKIYQESKDWEKAINVAKKLQLARKEDFSFQISHFYCEIAKTYLEEKNISLAVKNTKNALSANKDCLRAKILAADIDIAQDKYRSGLKQLECILDIASDYLLEIIPKIIICHQKLNKSCNIENYWNKLLSSKQDIKLVVAYVNYLQSIKGEQFALDYLTNHLVKCPSILGLNKAMELNFILATSKFKYNFDDFNLLVNKILQKKHNYKCSKCGFSSKALEWCCPGCKSWSSFKSALLFEFI